MSNRPQIGQLCTIKSVAVTKADYIGKDPCPKPRSYPIYTRLVSTPIQPEQAHYIGMRVIHEGLTHLEWDEDGSGRAISYPVFEHRKSHIVWLFIRNERSNPIRVLPADVEWDSNYSPELHREAKHARR